MSSDSEEIRFPLSVDKENVILKQTLMHLQGEINKFKKRPLLVCEVRKIYDDTVLIRLPNGNNFLVDCAEHLKGKLEINDMVVAEQKSLTVIDKLEKGKQSDVDSFVLIEKPKLNWEDIGGLDEQINEIKEVVELPLLKPELFKKIGIDPPRGILLHGPSGTGKTLLARAVASSTNSTFIEVIASELNQKFIGEGAKLVRDLFKMAKEKAPSIIFIDELDALAGERIESWSSGEREVQRTFMQLLAEIDGFDSLENVKVIGATNRMDILDEALIRPGRLDRLIEISLPGEKGRNEIFKIHTKRMNLQDVDLDELVKKTENFSGAEIKAVCTEAGYFAIRDNRDRIIFDDFLKAIDKLKSNVEEELNMFG